MADEMEREYRSEAEFEADRRRLFRTRGWVARERKPADDMRLPEVPIGQGGADHPGAGIILAGLVGLGMAGYAAWKLRRRGRFRVRYERGDG